MYFIRQDTTTILRTIDSSLIFIRSEIDSITNEVQTIDTIVDPTNPGMANAGFFFDIDTAVQYFDTTFSFSQEISFSAKWELVSPVNNDRDFDLSISYQEDDEEQILTWTARDLWINGLALEYTLPNQNIRYQDSYKSR